MDSSSPSLRFSTEIDSLSRATSITENYSSTIGVVGTGKREWVWVRGWWADEKREILINATFATNNLVILQKPNKMCIWHHLSLIMVSNATSRHYTRLLINTCREEPV